MSLPPSTVRCPLCDLELDPGAEGCKPSCPMGGSCGVLCCPGCGYSFPREQGLSRKLRELLDRRQHRGEKER